MDAQSPSIAPTGLAKKNSPQLFGTRAREMLRFEENARSRESSHKHPKL